jgi:beta-lactamase class D
MKFSLMSVLFIGIATLSFSKDQFLETYVKENKLNATVVIEEMKSGKEYIYNSKRANHEYLPASTFKIVNTLIALQEKACPNGTRIKILKRLSR